MGGAVWPGVDDRDIRPAQPHSCWCPNGSSGRGSARRTRRIPGANIHGHSGCRFSASSAMGATIRLSPMMVQLGEPLSSPVALRPRDGHPAGGRWSRCSIVFSIGFIQRHSERRHPADDRERASERSRPSSNAWRRGHPSRAQRPRREYGAPVAIARMPAASPWRMPRAFYDLSGRVGDRGAPAPSAHARCVTLSHGRAGRRASDRHARRPLGALSFSSTGGSMPSNPHQLLILMVRRPRS